MQMDTVERTVISEMFTLEAHNVLESQGYDIYGASWINKVMSIQGSEPVSWIAFIALSGR
jgi:hypothetical protein